MDEIKEDDVEEVEIVKEVEIEIAPVEEEKELIDITSTPHKLLKCAEVEKSIALETRMKQDDIEKKARLGM